jgi:hypothetical protein
MNRVGMVLLAAMTLSACGGSYCDTLETQNSRYFGSSPTCQYTENGTTVRITRTGTLASCRANFDQCNSADQAILNDYLSCFERVPACTGPNDKAAVTAMLGCASKLISGTGSSLSSACQNAFK